ncbi:MAG TPA: hypothetical protein VLD85_01675 [Anaeromyxobacteraceae bacterium]|nr:hypothetical protein [Anaeromyxobacteraceae bacterium]
MTRIDCQACGRASELPEGFAEGAEFRCAACGLLLRNVEASRRFRWADVDPYVRDHGASRVNLWGGMAGAFAWLPILAAVLAATGRFDALLLAALGLPYALLLLLLARRRARAPAARWLAWMWMGLGAYGCWVAVLLGAVPRWRALLLGEGAGARQLSALGLFGASALAAGLVGEILYRRRLARAPAFPGAPPAA